MRESVVPTTGPGAPSGPALKWLRLGVRVSLAFSPKPTALLVRRLFKQSAAERAAQQLREAPADIVAVIDERYDAAPDARLDVYSPAGAARSGEALPVVVWTHGGAFVGGSKDELGGYLRLIAAQGFTVVGIAYTLAPEGRYPTPVRQLMAALGHICGHAGRLHIDDRRIMLAGDSAGAQISAQVAALVTNGAYSAEMGIPPRLTPEQLRGVALCCGIFDLGAIPDAGPFKDFLAAVGWAYSGRRDFRNDASFMSTACVARHITSAFPPTFVTAGNSDPLLTQSLAFCSTLAGTGAEVDTLFSEKDHEPALGHEYQFDLDLEDGRTAFARLVSFFGRCADGASS